MQIIKEIGAYAGLAAIVGLAVLSALYFSQARDLRRLREWAGRAPERAAEMAGQPQPGASPVPRRGVAQPQPQPRPGTVAATRQPQPRPPAAQAPPGTVVAKPAGANGDAAPTVAAAGAAG